MATALRDILLSWDTFDYDPKLIKEAKEAGLAIVLKGVLQRADTLNQNGRLYPMPILQREIRNYQKLINEGRALGELDHPDSSVIELKNVSHIVREAYMDGGIVYGSVELLNTPAGKILQSLLESGVKLGISSRGVGSTKKTNEGFVVQDDFQLICWDFVSEPSTPGAFMLKEGKIAQSTIDEYFSQGDKIDRILNDMLEWE